MRLYITRLNFEEPLGLRAAQVLWILLGHIESHRQWFYVVHTGCVALGLGSFVIRVMTYDMSYVICHNMTYEVLATHELSFCVSILWWQPGGCRLCCVLVSRGFLQGLAAPRGGLVRTASSLPATNLLFLTLVLSLQCETSLDGEAGLCWCVYPWSGKRILGSLKIRGNPNCSQYFNLRDWKELHAV
jgi:hypothetical protein